MHNYVACQQVLDEFERAPAPGTQGRRHSPLRGGSSVTARCTLTGGSIDSRGDTPQGNQGTRQIGLGRL